MVIVCYVIKDNWISLIRTVWWSDILTWIVGTGTMFGHAILASDICVTLKYRTGTKCYVDCLQKVYPLGKYVVGGFAGSVKIGYSIIGHLQYELAMADKGEAWDLDIISNTWLPRVVKRIFNSFPDPEKDSKSQIILAATHLTMNWPFPHTPLPILYKFDSPDFKPHKASQDEVLGIGSGAMVDSMVEVNEVCKTFDFQKNIYGGMKYQAMCVADILERVINKAPMSGVSNLFQFATVGRSNIDILNHERYLCTADGKIPIIKFPTVLAANYRQLEKIVSISGNKLLCAVC